MSEGDEMYCSECGAVKEPFDWHSCCVSCRREAHEEYAADDGDHNPKECDQCKELAR
jgi:hypothetical protein